MRISFLVVMVISELNARFRLRFAELLKFLILIRRLTFKDASEKERWKVKVRLRYFSVEYGLYCFTETSHE